MRTRHLLIAVTALATVFLSAACSDDKAENPTPAPTATTTAAPTMSAPVAPASNPVPPSASGNASKPAEDSGVKACGTFDGKLGPDLPAPSAMTDDQLVQLRKDFGASAFKDLANYGVAFIDTVKQAKDGDDDATADDLAKASNNLAKACQAHSK